MPSIDNVLGRAREVLTENRVYGEPYEKNGVTLIPAAAIRGGAGGGEGEGGAEGGSGTGGGFGMTGRPVGAYLIKGDTVTWVPAADTTKVLLVAELVAIVALFVIRSVLRRRRT